MKMYNTYLRNDSKTQKMISYIVMIIFQSFIQYELTQG